MKSVQVTPFQKGQEGHGYTFYTIMSAATHLHMDKQGEFTQAEPSNEDVLSFDDEQSAVTHAEALDYVVEE